VFLWEVFEFAVKGFGEKEEIRNRLVDMGVALGAWILVVIPVMIFTGAPFPLADRYTP